MMMKLNADMIREAARGQWRCMIYPTLGINVRADKRHSACPHCGGTDRFRCDDREGNGSYFCNQCGAGDGFSLVMKVRRCTFPESLQVVAGVLGLDPHALIDRAALKRERRNREDERRARKQRQEQTGYRIDALREAEAMIAAASGIDISSWSDEQLHLALNRLAQAYETLRLEGLAHE